MEMRSDVLRIMRDYFSRPSSVHQGPEALVWNGSMPLIREDMLNELRMDDDMLYSVYREAARRACNRNCN